MHTDDAGQLGVDARGKKCQARCVAMRQCDARGNKQRDGAQRGWAMKKRKQHKPAGCPSPPLPPPPASKCAAHGVVSKQRVG